MMPMDDGNGRDGWMDDEENLVSTVVGRERRRGTHGVYISNPLGGSEWWSH